MTIRFAISKDEHTIVTLAQELWPTHKTEELQSEVRPLLSSDKAAFFLSIDDNGDTCGFAQCQLRTDYVEGTESSPVGYLEGIYVRPQYRGRGIARKLVSACEQWARDKHCTEFASDTEVSNQTSAAFHQQLGFKEVGRLIHFAKQL